MVAATPRRSTTTRTIGKTSCSPRWEILGISLNLQNSQSEKKPISCTINHTSVTSHNTVCPKEKDYGGSHTEEEPDHEDNRQNFYKFDKDNVSPIIGHTSGTSSNTACTKEDDGYEDDCGCGVSVTYASVNDYGYGASTDYATALISHTKKEYDYEDNAHLDEEYQLNEQKIRASRESQTSVGRTEGYHQGDRPPQWPRADRRHTSKTSGRKMWFFWPETFSTASLPLRNLISQVPRKSSQDLQQGHKKALADHKKDFF